MFAHESESDHPSPTYYTLHPDISLKLSSFLNLPVLKQLIVLILILNWLCSQVQTMTLNSTSGNVVKFSE